MGWNSWRAAIVLVALLSACSKKDPDPPKPADPATPTPTTPVVAPEPRRPDADPMASYFKALPPTPAAAATPEQFAGTWKATIVSADVDGDAAPLRDPVHLKPFVFVIKQAAGAWQMSAADGKGLPRTLTAAPGGVLARGEGAPDVRLSLRDGRLVGFIELDRPAKGRMEFHAVQE